MVRRRLPLLPGKLRLHHWLATEHAADGAGLSSLRARAQLGLFGETQSAKVAPVSIVTIGPTRVLNLRRFKNSELPADFVYVGRSHPRFPAGSRWGNVFAISKWGVRAGPLFAESLWLLRHDGALVKQSPMRVWTRGSRLQADLEADLLGRDLGCWCVGDRGCHGVVLALGAMGDWNGVMAAQDIAWWANSRPGAAS